MMIMKRQRLTDDAVSEQSAVSEARHTRLYKCNSTCDPSKKIINDTECPELLRDQDFDFDFSATVDD